MGDARFGTQHMGYFSISSIWIKNPFRSVFRHSKKLGDIILRGGKTRTRQLWAHGGGGDRPNAEILARNGVFEFRQKAIIIDASQYSWKK